MRQYYVYIMTNESRTLYTGITNNLERRVFEHKNHLVEGFTSKYKITKLVYIESVNPKWQDLSAEWNLDASLRSA